jgi:uncharacterized protein (DUF1697 family)
MSQHIALLRGINVGGNNIIKMVDLKKSFELMGFTEVSTYIQSGNVIFTTKGNATEDKAALEKTIEEALGRTFQYNSRVVVVSSQEMAQVLAQAPKGFGQLPDEYRYDVLFLKSPTTAQEVLSQLSLKDGVDAAFTGDHALYFQRLTSKASQSHLSRLSQKIIYQRVTVRNWNTTSKLHSLLSLSS